MLVHKVRTCRILSPTRSTIFFTAATWVIKYDEISSVGWALGLGVPLFPFAGLQLQCLGPGFAPFTGFSLPQCEQYLPLDLSLDVFVSGLLQMLQVGRPQPHG